MWWAWHINKQEYCFTFAGIRRLDKLDKTRLWKPFGEHLEHDWQNSEQHSNFYLREVWINPSKCSLLHQLLLSTLFASSTLLVACLVVLVAMFCALLCCCLCPSSSCCACSLLRKVETLIYKSMNRRCEDLHKPLHSRRVVAPVNVVL